MSARGELPLGHEWRGRGGLRGSLKGSSGHSHACVVLRRVRLICFGHTGASTRRWLLDRPSGRRLMTIVPHISELITQQRSRGAVPPCREYRPGSAGPLRSSLAVASEGARSGFSRGVGCRIIYNFRRGRTQSGESMIWVVDSPEPDSPTTQQPSSPTASCLEVGTPPLPLPVSKAHRLRHPPSS